jgi:hypothetical protein
VEGDFTDLGLLAGLGKFEIVLLFNALHEVFSDSYSADVEYKTIRLNIGYRFNIMGTEQASAYKPPHPEKQQKSVIYCPACGTKNDIAANYCVKCGIKLRR